ncbi:MAG: hypothetical protein Q8M19_11775 [Reyranella sp.]|nr:hypothetical protein [Reyranella sp.]
MRANFHRSTTLAAILLAASALTVSGTSPARADRCEDIAKELKRQVDGVKIGITTGKTIYLSHPHARELSLGCRGAKYSNELYVKADRRKPRPEFFQLVASAGAIVFTIPKPDVLRGSTRCINRMGLLRGDTVKMRFRRLNMECTRTRTEAAIAITRGTDE